MPANVHAFGNQQLTGQQTVWLEADQHVGALLVMQDTAAVALLLLLLCCYVAMTFFVLLP